MGQEGRGREKNKEKQNINPTNGSWSSHKLGQRLLFFFLQARGAAKAAGTHGGETGSKLGVLLLHFELRPGRLGI